MNPIQKRIQEQILFFDGAMGTSIQKKDLSDDDFWGKAGCNELLVLSRPDVIQEVHDSYLKAGCNVIETDTFGATRLVLGEYDEQERTYEINKKAVEIAKEVALSYSDNSIPRYVAGSIGPGTKLPSLLHISYKELKSNYYEQVCGMLDGGADILIIETCQDLLQIKAALGGAWQAFVEKRKSVPIMVSVTMETTGTMLMGSDMQSVITTLSPFDIVSLGLNCATGPQEMSEHIRTLSKNSPYPISCIPNAGLPENVGGHAHYHLSASDMVKHLTPFIKELGVSIVGGCCGTTPEHIQALVQNFSGLAPAHRNIDFIPSVSSLYQSVPTTLDPRPLIVGERTNANGSKKFRELLQAEDWEGMVELAKEQVREGAHVLDVCVAYVGRDEVKDMCEYIERLNTAITIPIMIDSTEVNVIEAALERIAGKAIVNSVNFEDGEKRTRKVFELCKQFGAAVVALTIDEEGMAKTAQKKFDIAKRIYNMWVNEYKMPPEDIFFDTLTFTLGSGDEEFRKAGIETKEAIRLIKENLPGAKTLLGLSNISFGLHASIRPALNSVFLHECIEAGLDAAIMNASKIQPLNKIDPKLRQLCMDLIYDNRIWEEVQK